jgi:tetraacyldisaccharide 4'-kinase
MVEPAHTAAQVGDEPLLLARVAPTVVAAERTSGARLAKAHGASVIVMDDGFQNPSLVKDLAILVADARGTGNGRVIPAGPLRAPLEAQLAHASAMLVVGPGAAATESTARARGLPVFHGALEPDAGTVAALRGKSVLAFAGIGDPEKFFATLGAAGVDAPVRRGFADHHCYSAAEARALIGEAEQGQLDLLTTEKDLMRLKDDAALAALAKRARALPVEMKVTEADALAGLIRGACAKFRRA